MLADDGGEQHRSVSIFAAVLALKRLYQECYNLSAWSTVCFLNLGLHFRRTTYKFQSTDSSSQCEGGVDIGGGEQYFSQGS